MTDRRKALVEAGYDALGRRYLEWSRRVEGDPRGRFLGWFAQQVGEGEPVLDLGCGPGVPSTRSLAARFDVTGVDVSEAQLELARNHVPTARFVHGDMASVSFDDGSFAGVTALYSFTHIAREEQAALFRRVHGWLQPHGAFLVVLGAGDLPDWTGDWLGVPMFFSAYDADTNRRLLVEAGFELLLDEIVEMHEPEGDVAFLWVLARKL